VTSRPRPPRPSSPLLGRDAPSAARTPNPVTSSVVSIRRLVRALRLHAQRTQSATGVGSAQLFVLQQLGADTQLSLNELAARTLTDRSSVADIVDRLLAHGLVDREVDPRDRRRAAVRITAAGRRMLAKAPEAPTTALISALRSLSARERTALARSLSRLNDALGVADEPATMLFVDDADRRRPRQSRRDK
jgi:DNA-binding MarR family transcriptional regulator